MKSFRSFETDFHEEKNTAQRKQWARYYI